MQRKKPLHRSVLLLVTFFLLLAAPSFLSAQYYLRGEVKDEQNNKLQNVKLLLHSNGIVYTSGENGGFGIVTDHLYDSLTISMSGYEDQLIRFRADAYLTLILKVAKIDASLHKKKLSSFIINMDQQSRNDWIYGDESYSALTENDFIKANKYPDAGFAVRIDKASYSNIRRFINDNTKPPKDAVRVEEMLNYFNNNYVPPPGDDLFHIESQLTSCPWNATHQLLFLNINAKKLVPDNIPPSNFVFLIDNSGSMDLPNRLPLLKEAFRLLVKNLREKDMVSIVTYGGGVSVALQPTRGTQKQKITQAIELLQASGDTPGAQGLVTAYRVAQSTFINGGNNRIILATDGDFNVGITSDRELEDLVSREKQSGVSLTCLGVGMGNYKDSKIETLAKKGNGNYAYLDNMKEAEKFLITELAQNLYTVAKDVYLSVKFNPQLVKEYRLIGYDNKIEALIDAHSDLEGGEVGSGNGTTAIFEILPNTPSASTAKAVLDSNIASLQLNFTPFKESVAQNLKYNCPQNYIDINKVNKDLRFASAVAMFGMLLRESKFISPKAWDMLLVLTKSSITPTDYLQSEFLNLAGKAKLLYIRKRGKLRK